MSDCLGTKPEELVCVGCRAGAVQGRKIKLGQLLRNGDYMTEGEKLSAERLATELPADWIVVTNKTLVSRKWGGA